MTPVISVSALIPAGDKDKSGLSLTATALKHGTKISQKQS
jgi:hypothetical protein